MEVIHVALAFAKARRATSKVNVLAMPPTRTHTTSSGVLVLPPKEGKEKNRQVFLPAGPQQSAGDVLLHTRNANLPE